MNQLYFVCGVLREDRAVILAPTLTALHQLCPFPIVETEVIDLARQDYGVLLATENDPGGALKIYEQCSGHPHKVPIDCS